MSCYSQGAPDATCALPNECCFTNYSSLHNGTCSTAGSCVWGAISCDGPEDCPSGGHCCSTELFDADGIAGYRVACQATPCGSPPFGEELCHLSGPACSNGGLCRNVLGLNNDLPRSLYICR